MIADVLIKNARICDGTGDPVYNGSIAVKDGRIIAVGQFDAEAREVHDAGGKVAAPGFIDPHTHFDAQLLWDGRAERNPRRVARRILGNVDQRGARIAAEINADRWNDEAVCMDRRRHEQQTCESCGGDDTDAFH